MDHSPAHSHESPREAKVSDEMGSPEAPQVELEQTRVEESPRKQEVGSASSENSGELDESPSPEKSAANEVPETRRPVEEEPTDRVRKSAPEKAMEEEEMTSDVSDEANVRHSVPLTRKRPDQEEAEGKVEDEPEVSTKIKSVI